MKGTLVVMSSNREIEPRTNQVMRRLSELGSLTMLELGSADVAFARCRALSWACNQLREHPERDMVLMLDDDMDVPTDTAQQLVALARTLDCAVSAVYSTATRKVAAQRYALRQGRWLVGLGCLAIPRTLLLSLEERCESFELRGMVYSAFTWCGPENGSWVAEDWRLSMRLGGVHLAPLAVGHIKKTSLWPSPNTLQRLADGEKEIDDEEA